ncbi:hypothetical protein [Mesonia sp. K7]|uniref:hypothetical protein n=1 Tax=Mesonia sp. K7 TaxID=2218606 RepID=UPI000DA889AC|nr:hypothetical protein [Mesonia sp. K7]PZD76771.1 hypothetical protein DNG35_10945 [Mesonia sp. K7]
MSHLTIKRKCTECNKDFIAKSSKGIYCSKKCFKKKWRLQQKQNSVVLTKEKPIITKEYLQNKHYLSVKESVIFFEISENILRRKIKENRLNYICLKKRFLFLKSDLIKIL